MLGDSWFGSVKAAAELDCEAVFQVKTAHALYPKKYIEKALEGGPGGIWIVMKGTHTNGKALVAVGYMYSSRKTLFFIATEGAGSTRAGDPYEMKWADEWGNIQVRNVQRPEMLFFF